MALANIAWLLAETGQRVLMIDWDLEAPGLHRYFHPFLLDPELETTEGVIDYLWDYMSSALRVDSSDSLLEAAREFADLGRCAVALDYPFRRGALDLIPAGRQGASYSQRVNTFEWHQFYGPLGGSSLLAADREKLREQYDVVLIDSRTGVSDTSGICTVELPDALVVCFTSNTQSIAGAAAVVESVQAQRDSRQLTTFPVLMRVELAEKDKLDVTRKFVREKFTAPYSDGISVDGYWSDAEVLYQPFYAYEEILAFFGDPPGISKTLLHDMTALASLLAGYKIRVPYLPEEERKSIRNRFLRRPTSTTLDSQDLQERAASARLLDELQNSCARWMRLNHSPMFLISSVQLARIQDNKVILQELRNDPVLEEFYVRSREWERQSSRYQRYLRFVGLILLPWVVGIAVFWLRHPLWQPGALSFVSTFLAMFLSWLLATDADMLRFARLAASGRIFHDIRSILRQAE